MGLAAARPGPLRRRFEGVDAVHYALTIQLPRLALPKAVTIQDLQHLDLPQLFSRAERRFRRHAYEASVRSADAVIVPSQFVRRGVVEHLGVPPERIHAIPHGVDHDRFFPTGEPREEFLLYPARPWAHKNHERLFEAFALLRRERPAARARAHRRRSRGPAGPGRGDRQGADLGRRARLALPSRRLPRLPEPLRGLRLSAARGDGLRLSGRHLERRLARRGRRRRRGDLRPEPTSRTSRRSSRPCSRARSASSTPGSRAPPGSPGPRLGAPARGRLPLALGR